MAPPKRKRPDRTYSQDDGRPSPHRPGDLRMAHQQSHPHSQQNSPRGGGNRRQSRPGGRGGSSMPPSPSVSHSASTAMSPPTNPSSVNKPAQTALPAPFPSNDRPQTPSPTREVPESNEYLTPERVAKWNGQARDAVVQAAKSAQSEGDILTVAVVYHEIIEAAMYSLLSSTELGSMVRDIVAAPSTDDIDTVATFLDTLSSLTLEKDKHSLVRQLLIATDIDVSRMRTDLESELLGTIGLVRDSFSKMAVRKATLALYRQSNYNLLREETEGYSKLMTEYFTTVNNEPPSQEVVSETYQRVNALIGAFDLDIGRVLDVTLDVFANLLVKHGRFFVKLLRSSAWWPELRGLDGIEWEEPEVATLPHWAQPSCSQWYCSEQEKEQQLLQREQRDRKFWQRVGELGERAGIQAYFELGARRIITNNRQPDQTLPATGASMSKQQAARKWTDDWIKETGTLPPSGNDIAAQLLGFKLRFYASDARDASDFLPDNLIYLAALLIKIGFISILDLYPHLYPLEEDMAAHKDKLLKAKKDKEQKERGGISNALTMAGALPDETPHGYPAVTRLRDAASKSESERSSPAKSDEATEKKASLPEPADQKYQLLRSLLCIGALPEALFILGRHPWLLEVYPDLLDFIFRLAHHSVSKVYETTRPTVNESVPVAVKGAGLRNSTRPCDYIPRRTLRWAKPDMKDAGDGIDYKFYWEDWVDNVPVCQEVDDIIKLCTSLLGLLGPECGRDTVLLTKIVRIGKKSLVDDPSDDNLKRWRAFSATFIAPSLSFTGKNPGIINEVWALFKHFDTATRYTIYQQWFTSTKPASIRDAFEKVRAATNHELSRVAAKNTKEYGRKIAKISYSSPGIVFQLTLKRLINYPNMIDTLVECVRYLTLLGYDCLTWTLVNFFLRPEKGGTQDDGMLAAPWLKNIASFVGKAYQKYSFMDPTPVLQFTTHQLLQAEGELYMLDVLEQMIKSMGGISISGSLSEAMTLALCAGPILRTFTLQHHLSDHRHQAGTSARRLIRCLKDTGLAPQILLALAQHVEAYVYREDQADAPDKVVLFNLDKLRSNLLQYLELLRTYLSVDDFDKLFPGPIEMISNFGIEPDIAFTVARASIAAKINAARGQKQTETSECKIQSNHDVDMSDAEDAGTVNGVSTTPNPTGSDTPIATDVEMRETSENQDDSSQQVSPVTNETPSSVATNPEVEALVEQLKSQLPDTFAEHPCLSFYVTFWQLSLPDVDDGGIKQQYASTIAHFERLLPGPVPERRGYHAHRKETDEMRRAKVEIGKLKDEEQKVLKVNSLTQNYLVAEMQRWFEDIPMLDSRSDALHNALLQDCFLPRSRMSLQDAQFASAMLKFMHNSGAPGFRTIKLLDLLFNANKLSCIISMYSVDEAQTFGRFINSILRELQRWHQDKDDAYAKSAHGAQKNLPGFGRRFDSDRYPVEHLQYDDFCKLLYKWHKALFMALKGCLESDDFQQIRNSLNILTSLSGSFPKVDTMAKELQQSIEYMTEHDERNDVKTTAQSSLFLFRKAEKDLQSEYKFRNLPEPPKPAPTPSNVTSKANSEKANTPQPLDSAAARMNVNAPSFRPKGELNGVQRVSTEQGEDNTSKRPPLTPATPATSRESVNVAPRLHDSRANTPAQTEKETSKINTSTPVPSSHTSAVPPRPDGRNTPQSTPVGRPAHTLPTRPDSQPQRTRQSERPNVERPSEHATHGRYDNRGPSNDYGRLDRPGEAARQRELSPTRRGRPVPGGRTPERAPPVVDHRDWPGRDVREYGDRAMRAPPRDTRMPPTRPPPTWDSREQRDRPDSRGHPGSSSMEPRRMPSSSSLNQDHNAHRRDLPPNHPHHGAERGEHGPSPSMDGPMVNPARAAIINQAEHDRPELSSHDRDSRRDRGSRPHSPRRGDDRPHPGYHNRNEVPREYREERGAISVPPGSRDRRDEAVAGTPTGPRGGRNEPPPAPGASREMFQPSQPSRSSGRQPQDPNYGRLTQPSDSMPPSGPRSERPHTQPQLPIPAPPSGPAASAGIHPSRLDNIQRAPPGPALQTNMPNAPSGPRGAGRPSQGPPLSSPVSRGPPTGPAATERGPRGGERRNPLGTINSVLTQNAPSQGSNDRAAASPPNPPVRGRGATRANGSVDGQGGMTSPMLPPSHISTPNARVEASHPRSNRAEHPQSRVEGAPQDDSRAESRSHRDSRRGERSGRDRSHSQHQTESRTDDRAIRNGPTDRPARTEGEERDRGSREKRGGERDGSGRRDRERPEGERAHREPRESREGGRRERSSRDDGRTSVRDERRSRGGGVADDGRKRGRDLQDQGQGHGDTKRRR